jgi:hypothetical protein
VRDPVLGAHPDAVFADGREGDGGGGVLDGLAEAVGEQVGRAHEVDELRVEGPTAGRLEILGFEQHMLGTAARQGGRDEKGGEEREGEREAEEGVHG